MSNLINNPHTYSNGAMSSCIVVDESLEALRTGMGVIPAIYQKKHLILGTDKKKSYVWLQMDEYKKEMEGDSWLHSNSLHLSLGAEQVRDVVDFFKKMGLA